MGSKTRAGLSPQEQKHQHLGKDPSAWGHGISPNICRWCAEPLPTHMIQPFPSLELKDVCLQNTLSTGLLRLLSESAFPENILEDDPFLVSFLLFVSSAASVEGIRF